MTTRLPLRTRGLAAVPALSMLLLGAPIPARAQAPDGSTPPPTAGTAMRGSTASPTGGGELIGDENAGGSASNGPLPHNTCRKAPRGTRFTVTLPKETELEDLINWMMSITCQKFIWDRKVRSGKVTIMSPEPVTVDEAYAAFYAALETMGLTVERPDVDESASEQPLTSTCASWLTGSFFSSSAMSFGSVVLSCGSMGSRPAPMTTS